MTKTITSVAFSNTNQLSNTKAVIQRPRIHKMNSEAYRDFQKRNASEGNGSSEVFSTTGHTVYNYADVVSMNFNPSPWLFHGLMRANEVAMVYAGTGVGKTWLTLSLAMIAAGGGRLLDWSSDSPRRVLYLDGEMDAAELVGRMKVLARGLKCNPDALAKNFVLCARQMQKTITGNFIEIETEESQLGILGYAQEHGFQLVVVDNLTTLSGQLDENASKDMKPFNTFLLRAKQLGIAVLVVHHQGKGKDSGPRGSTAMMATFNLILKLEGSTQERAAGDKDARFTVVFEKNRGNVENRPLPVRVTSSAADEFSEGDGSVVLAIDADADTNGVRLKRLLLTGRYRNQIELAKAFGKNTTQGTISKMLKAAVAQKVLTREEIDDCYRRAREAVTDESCTRIAASEGDSEEGLEDF